MVRGEKKKKKHKKKRIQNNEGLVEGLMRISGINLSFSFSTALQYRTALAMFGGALVGERRRARGGQSPYQTHDGGLWSDNPL